MKAARYGVRFHVSSEGPRFKAVTLKEKVRELKKKAAKKEADRND